MTAAPRGAALYTPELLALAVSLADHPLDPEFPIRGDARSRTCGSSVAFACAVGPDGAIERIGLRASACAVGQAAAAIFANDATGRDAASIAHARDQLALWIVGAGPMPAWPGIAALDAARAYPARHGAIPLAWDAALAALSKPEGGG